MNVDAQRESANPPGGGFAHANRRTAPLPHILIVDDKSCDGWIWAGALRRAGFRISIAADTDDGWYAVEGDSHALLIVCQGANARKDCDLIRKLRTFSRQPPCILVLEKQTPQIEEPVGLLQPELRLRKPVTVPRILAAVRKLLREEVEALAGFDCRGKAQFEKTETVSCGPGDVAAG